MIEYYSRHMIVQDSGLPAKMHAERKKVFVDMMKWNIPHTETEEKDEFDDEFAEYLILSDPETQEHNASVRLLRTDRRHLLGSVFPFLCEKEVPTGHDVREITRYLLSPRLKPREMVKARNMLARSLIEYGLANGITTYSAVCEMSVLSEIISAGWRCDPLGLPQFYEGEWIGAFVIHVEEDSLARMVKAWKWDKPVLSFSRHLPNSSN